jgi:hypothetical protein
MFQSPIFSVSHQQLSWILYSAMIWKSDGPELSVLWIFSDLIPNSADFSRSSLFSLNEVLKQSKTPLLEASEPANSTISTWLGLIIGVAVGFFILIIVILIFILVRRRSHKYTYSMEPDSDTPNQPTELSETRPTEELIHSWYAPDEENESTEDSSTNDLGVATPAE